MDRMDSASRDELGCWTGQKSMEHPPFWIVFTREDRFFPWPCYIVSLQQCSIRMMEVLEWPKAVSMILRANCHPLTCKYSSQLRAIRKTFSWYLDYKFHFPLTNVEAYGHTRKPARNFYGIFPSTSQPESYHLWTQEISQKLYCEPYGWKLSTVIPQVFHEGFT